MPKNFKILPNWRNFAKSGHTGLTCLNLRLTTDDGTKREFLFINSSIRHSFLRMGDSQRPRPSTSSKMYKCRSISLECNLAELKTLPLSLSFLFLATHAPLINTLKHERKFEPKVSKQSYPVRVCEKERDRERKIEKERERKREREIEG